MSDVVAYHVLVCALFTSAGMYVDCSPHTSLYWKQYMICCNIAHNNEIFIIITRDFSKEKYVVPEDDTRYAIETCRSILSVLKGKGLPRQAEVAQGVPGWLRPGFS